MLKLKGEVWQHDYKGSTEETVTERQLDYATFLICL